MIVLEMAPLSCLTDYDLLGLLTSLDELLIRTQYGFVKENTNMQLVILFTHLALLLAFSISPVIAQEMIYRGTETTTIKVFHPLTGQILDQNTFIKNVQVVTNPSVQAGGVTETNPINLQINPDCPLTQEGHLSITSAIPAHFLLQYWDLNRIGNHYTGILTEDHVEETSAFNLLNTLDISLLLIGVRFVNTFAVMEERH